MQIDLIVRGVCCLRPGIPGLSETIRVRSVVGRFLEHTRVFYFENGGDPDIFCASADWMNRNLLQRVETCFPILDETLKQRVFNEGLEIYLEDNRQAWLMRSDGSYERTAPSDGEPLAAQLQLLEGFTRAGAPPSAPLPKRFRRGQPKSRT